MQRNGCPDHCVVRNCKQHIFEKYAFPIETIFPLLSVDKKKPDVLSQWPRGLRHRSAAARLLRSWVRIPPGAWNFVCFECYVLSGRGLCDELITRPEESYRLWFVIVCDLENLKNEEAMTRVGSQSHRKKIEGGDYL